MGTASRKQMGETNGCCVRGLGCKAAAQIRPGQEKLFDMANGEESSVIETIAKALWVFFMREIGGMAADEQNPIAGDDVSGPRLRHRCKKIKTYSKRGSIFIYRSHR
jgi:hypothetical protein